MDLEELAMMLECVDVDSTDSSDFYTAVGLAKSYNFDNDHKLILFGLFKQGTVGDVNYEEPSESDTVAHSKWKAWKGFQGYPPKTACAAYTYLVKTWRENGTQPIDNSAQASMQMGPSQSKPVSAQPGVGWDNLTEALFSSVEVGDTALVQKALTAGMDVNQKNKEGLTPLHYAADRGYLEIVKLLIQHKADPTAVDSEGQTPLDLAEVCEHDDVIQFLRTQSMVAI